MTNPYTPQLMAPSTGLSRREAEFLRFRSEHRNDTPGLLAILRRQRWFRGLLAGAVATVLATALHPDFGVVAGAVITATLARDLVWIVQSRRVWWLIQATTDWAEVDRILREGGHG